MVFVKICGLKDVRAADAALSGGASYLGVICVPNLRRTVTPPEAKAISALVRSRKDKVRASLVGVFQNQDIEEVVRVFNDYGLDALQLHGSERWQDYRQRFPKEVKIIKRVVFPRDCEELLAISADPTNNCMALLDSEAGGSGEVLDWEGIANWCNQHREARFILAGGLTPQNVTEAVKLPGVVGVDVSGGVETKGQKDIAKIFGFVRNAIA